jgi:hypothetical protein
MNINRAIDDIEQIALDTKLDIPLAAGARRTRQNY